MPVVTGIEAFKQALAGHESDYVLIGGGACSILFDMEALSFRATKDLDIVVLADSEASGFARALWGFIKRNGYESWSRTEGRCSYFRFILPKNSPSAERLPGQIELFARRPNFMLGNETSEIAPLPFDEDVSSLSAIILEEGYYEFIKRNVSKAEGVPLLTALHIIPLKMRAHIDLNRRHRAGQHVNDKDLVKHRGDVSKLSRLLAPTDRLPLEGTMREDAEEFLIDFQDYTMRQTNRKLRRSLEGDLETLRATYLGEPDGR